MQYLGNWERNHNTTPDLKNSKIVELELKKEELLKFFKEANMLDGEIELNGHIDITLKTHSVNNN